MERLIGSIEGNKMSEEEKKEMEPEAKRMRESNEEGHMVGPAHSQEPYPMFQKRAPFTKTHKLSRSGGKYHLLIGVTGSVATIKLQELIQLLHTQCKERLIIKIVATKAALQFIDKMKMEIEEVIYEDGDEWSMWQGRGDPVLHIELRKWADSMLIAPLDANTLGKIANGLCDNLLTSLVRAWDPTKTLLFAPAMNTFMWESPLTFQQRTTLRDLLRFKEIPPIEKDLMCGESGMGAMATVHLMASMVAANVRSKFAVYTS